MNRLSTATLAKIAGVGGFALLGMATLTLKTYQDRLKGTKNYKKLMNIFYEHPKAASYLGRPIVEGDINIQDTEGADTVWFSVVLKGSNTRGTLYCQVDKTNDPTVVPEIRTVEIVFDDVPDKTFVLMQKESSIGSEKEVY